MLRSSLASRLTYLQYIYIQAPRCQGSRDTWSKDCSSKGSYINHDYGSYFTTLLLSSFSLASLLRQKRVSWSRHCMPFRVVLDISDWKTLMTSQSLLWRLFVLQESWVLAVLAPFTKAELLGRRPSLSKNSAVYQHRYVVVKYSPDLYHSRSMS